MDASQSDAHGTATKRVIKACNHCRQKRLKCTTAQYPCPNCQLYGAECVYPTGPAPSKRRRAGGGARQRSHPDAPDAPETPVPSSVSTRLDPPLQVHQQDAGSSFDGMLSGAISSSDDLMDVWNETLDFSAFVFEGLRPSPTARGSESQVSSSQRGNREAGGKVSGMESLAIGDSRGESTERILPGLFIRKDSANSNFIGLNSTGATVAFCMREALKSSSGLSGSADLDWLMEAAVHVDEAAVPHSSTTELRAHELPNRSVAEAAIQAFFEAVYPTYPVIDKQSFRSSWPQLYEPSSTTTDRDQLSLFHLVVAIGDLNRKSSTEVDLREGTSFQQFYQRSWAMLSDCLAEPNVSTVQILLLHVIFHMQCCKAGFAWVLCGLAIRVAQAVGLHRRSPEDLDLNEADMGLRSRIWWIAYRLDGILSFTQGRPATVHASSFDMDMTSLSPNESHGQPPSTTAEYASISDVYDWSSRLSEIQHRFCKVTNQANNTMSLLDELGNIDRALLSWCHDLPMDCRPGEEILSAGNIGQLLVSLHLDYFNLMRAVHWASLTCAHAKRSVVASHPNPRIRGSEAICLSAARSFIKTLNDATNNVDNSKNNMFCTQVDYLMCAISVLYRHIFKYPQRMSAKADVEHLRAGKIHFERQVPGLVDVNSTLDKLFQAMVISAERVTSKEATLEAGSNTITVAEPT